MPQPKQSVDGAKLTEPPPKVSGITETWVAPVDDGSWAASGFGPPVAVGEVGTLGPYRLVKELGRGGMGAVYAAIDTRLERKIALKVMLPAYATSVQAKERFVREARAVAKISHDNVVTVFEADERQGVPYIAMQYLEGYPLDEYLKKKGNLSVAQILRIGMEAAAGLAAAHRIGLVHRDIKPGNLWLEAPRGRVKVLDFGLAKPVDAEVELTKSGAVVGTPAYMSPEQARGEKVDHRTDLFSLGALLYRLCTGNLPFSGPTTMAVLMALGTEEPPPVRDSNPAVPEALAALVHQLLAKNPDARPPSAEDVARQLRAIDEGRAAPSADRSTSLPQAVAPEVVYIPIQVTELPAASPFADIDVTEPETAPTPSALRQPQPQRTKSPGLSPWLLAAGALAALVLGGFVVIIKNRDGSETKIEVPDGSTVTVKDKAGTTLAKVEPKQRPATDTSVDRKAAEWVIAQGGAVKVSGVARDITAAADLPKEKFHLTAVNLNDKPVTDADLAIFKDCKALTHLHLQNCTAVTDAGLAHFKDCKALRELHLTGTAVTDAGLTHFKDCKALTHLSLQNCTAVTDAGLAHFKDCKGLTLLELGGCTAVTDAGLAHFKDCKGLIVLHLGGTKVTDAGLAHFKDCKGLAYLQLGGTAVTDAGLAHFKDCQALGQLFLYGTKVTDAGLVHLKGCKSLVFLELGGTAVADAGLVHLKDCKGLITLSLYGTKVTDAGLVHLKDCKELTFLDLRGRKVSAQGLADFHAAVPGCKIEHGGGIIEAVATDDRKAAEWVMAEGGSVKVNGDDRDIAAVAELPKEQFNLTSVILNDKPVTDAGLAQLKGLKNLTDLELNGTKVTDAGLTHIKELQSLTLLRLNSAAVTDAGLAQLKGLKNLKDLWLGRRLKDLGLGHSEVTDAGLAHLKELKNLTGLWLGGTQVTDAGLAQLKELKLTGLGLDDTAVTDAGLAQLKEFNSLTGLWLNGTPVTDGGLAQLKEFKNLMSLNLKKTKVTATGLADFHAAVPGCKVEHDGGIIEPK